MTRITTLLAAALLCLSTTALAAGPTQKAEATKAATVEVKAAPASEQAAAHRAIDAIQADMEKVHKKISMETVKLSHHSNWPFTNKDMAAVNRGAKRIGELHGELRALQAELDGAVKATVAKAAATRTASQKSGE